MQRSTTDMVTIRAADLFFWMSKTGIKDELLDALLHINGKQAQAGTPQPSTNVW